MTPLPLYHVYSLTANLFCFVELGAQNLLITDPRDFKGFVALLLSGTILANLFGALIPTRTGAAFNQVLEGEATRRSLLIIALSIVAIVLLRALFNVSARYASEFLGNRFARDARDELVVSLLGKSQTFHNRQRVGDIMARSTNDVTLLRDMVTPGVDLIVDSTVALIMKTGTPISFRRVIVLGASFVWSVLNTMWPVREAWTAISAVSRSRISPTRILSGSCRRMARRQLANVLPIEASMGTWMIPSMSYSTGSSVVISLSWIVLSSFSAE